MVDSITVGILLISLVGFAIWYSLRHLPRTLSSFSVGNEDRNWFQIAAGLTMTYVGGAATLNMASLGYSYGLQALVDPAAVFIGLLIVFYFLPYYRAEHSFTMTGALSGSSASLSIFLGVIGFLVYLLMTSAQFVALSKLLSPIFPFIQPEITIIISSFLVLFYVWLGGFRVVNLTDVIQFIFVLFLYLIPIVIILFLSGDVRKSTDDNLHFQNIPADLAILLCLSIIFVPLSQDVQIRIKAARNAASARIGVIVAGISYILLVGAAVLVGHNLFTTGFILDDPEMALPTFFQAYLGPLHVLATLAVLAAIVSTLDSFAFAAVVTITQDVLRPTNERTSKHYIRGASTCVFLGSVLISVVYPHILGLILTGLLIYVSVLGPIAIGRRLHVSHRLLLASGLVTVVGIVLIEILYPNIEPKAIIYPCAHLAIVFLLHTLRRTMSRVS